MAEITVSLTFETVAAPVDVLLAVVRGCAGGEDEDPSLTLTGVAVQA
jgi:hypothetical protein